MKRISRAILRSDGGKEGAAKKSTKKTSTKKSPKKQSKMGAASFLESRSHRWAWGESVQNSIKAVRDKAARYKAAQDKAAGGEQNTEQKPEEPKKFGAKVNRFLKQKDDSKATPKPKAAPAPQKEQKCECGGPCAGSTEAA